MIQLAPDQPRLLKPSGFAWWYLDLLDAHGDGLVLVWATGLPFLPGEGAPGCAAAVNVAVYRAGRPEFYLLEEIPAARVEVDGDVIRLGRSWFRSTVTSGERVVTAWLDCPVPGATGRLTGTVRLRGAALSVTTIGDLATSHAWTPLAAPARATARLGADGFRFERTGRGYHDRNRADVPLDALGIRAWTWGRLALPHSDLVWYDLEPEEPGAARTTLVLEARDGVLRTLPGGRVSATEPRRDLYGRPWAEAVRVEWDDHAPVDVIVQPPVDSGPFYLRHRLRSGEAWGWGEACWPGAVDRAWQRPFVRMRVASARPSAWAPLFSGPASGRITRLARWWATP